MKADNFKSTRNGLIIKGSPSFADCSQMLKALAGAHVALHWQIGDLLNYMENSFGETYAQVMDETSFSYSTLSRDKYLAKRFPQTDRLFSPPLGQSHYEAVANIENSDIRNTLLRQCIDLGWTRDMLRIKAKPFKGGPEAQYTDDTSFHPDEDEWLDTAARQASRRLIQDQPDVIWSDQPLPPAANVIQFPTTDPQALPTPQRQAPQKQAQQRQTHVKISIDDFILMNPDSISDALSSGPVMLVGKGGVTIGIIIKPELYDYLMSPEDIPCAR